MPQRSLDSKEDESNGPKDLLAGRPLDNPQDLWITHPQACG